MNELIGRILGVLLIFLSVAVGSYLVTAFVFWETNPAEWGNPARLALSFVVTGITVMLVAERVK